MACEIRSETDAEDGLDDRNGIRRISVISWRHEGMSIRYCKMPEPEMRITGI